MSLQYFGRLAQLVERDPYTVDVGGSNPSPPTTQHSVLGEMDIMLVFETSGGSSILSGPAKCKRKWLRSSVRQNVGLQNQMSEVQILSGSPIKREKNEKVQHR